MSESYLNNLKFTYVKGGISPVSKIDSGDYRVYPNWILVCPQNESGKVEIRNDSIKYFRQDEAVVIKPNVQHRFFMASQSTVISLWSHVNFSLPGNIDVAQFLDTPLIVTGSQGKRIGEINAQLAKLPQNEFSLQTESRFLELGFSLLSIICSVSVEKDMSDFFSDQSQRIRDMLLYIDRNLDKELTRDSLANYCGLSTARFHVVFQKCTGMAPMKFVKDQRMNKAKILLVRTSISISQISRMIGYNDPYTFSREFRKTVGFSPRPYRLQARRDGLFPV